MDNLDKIFSEIEKLNRQDLGALFQRLAWLCTDKTVPWDREGMDLDETLTRVADSILQKDYFDHVRAIAKEAEDYFRELCDENPDSDVDDLRDDLDTYLHETVDGSQMVIYTAQSLQVLRYSDHDSEGIEEGLVEINHKTTGWQSQLAYHALLADVRDYMDSLEDLQEQALRTRTEKAVAEMDLETQTRHMKAAGVSLSSDLVEAIMEGDYSLEEEPEEEPEDGDGFLVDVGMGSKVSASFNGKHIGDFSNRADAEKALKAEMDRQQYWPNVWHVSDHGNHNLVTDLGEE